MKSKLKVGKKARKKVGQKQGRKQQKTDDNVSLSELVKAKTMITDLGGVEKTKSLIQAIEKLQD